MVLLSVSFCNLVINKVVLGVDYVVRIGMWYYNVRVSVLMFIVSFSVVI